MPCEVGGTMSLMGGSGPVSLTNQPGHGPGGGMVSGRSEVEPKLCCVNAAEGS